MHETFGDPAISGDVIAEDVAADHRAAEADLQAAEAQADVSREVVVDAAMQSAEKARGVLWALVRGKDLFVKGSHAAEEIDQALRRYQKLGLRLTGLGVALGYFFRWMG